MEEDSAKKARRIPVAVTQLGLVLLASCTSGPRRLCRTFPGSSILRSIAGEMDWGSEVGFDLRNNGEHGVIHIVGVLLSSEGQWSRSQDLELETRKSRHLTYFFHEPTISVTNLQALVRVNP